MAKLPWYTRAIRALDWTKWGLPAGLPEIPVQVQGWEALKKVKGLQPAEPPAGLQTFFAPKILRAAEQEIAGHIARVLTGQLDPTRATLRINQLHEKGLITETARNNAIEAFRVITPESIPEPLEPQGRPLTWIGPLQKLSPVLQTMTDLVEKAATEELPYHEAVGKMRDLGDDVPPERIQQGLIALTVAVGRPPEVTPRIYTAGGMWSKVWNFSQIPSQIITQEILRLMPPGAKAGLQESTEDVMATITKQEQERVGVGEMIQGAWQGYRSVIDPIATLREAGATPGETFIFGGGLLAATEPANYFLAGVGVWGKAGTKAMAAADSIGAKLAAKVGAETVVGRVFQAMGLRASEMVPFAHMRAFGRGYLQGIPEELGQVGRAMGLADDVADDAAKQFVTALQNDVRVQPRLWKKPILAKKEWTLRDVTDSVQTTPAKWVKQATERALERLGPTAAARKEAAVREVGFASYRHEKYVALLEEELVKVGQAKRAGPGGVFGLARSVERFFLPSGSIDPALNTELERLAMTMTNESALARAKFLRPVSDLSVGEQQIIYDALGQQVKVRSEEFAKLTKLKIGDFWGLQERELLEWIVARTGESWKPGKPLPEVANKLWGRIITVRGNFEEAWQVVDDAGLSMGHKEFYLPTKVSPDKTYTPTARATSFLRKSHWENPYVLEMMKSAGFDDMPSALKDLPSILETYAQGTADLSAHRQMLKLVDRYGVRNLNPVASKVMGWEAFEPGYSQGAWGLIGEQLSPEALTKVLPPGFNEHWARMIAPAGRIPRALAKGLAPARMSVLNIQNPVFHATNAFDQFPSALMAGWPGSRNFGMGVRLSARELMSEMPSWLLQSGPRTWAEKLRFQISAGERALLDAVDTQILERISQTRVAQKLSRLMRTQGYSDDLIQEIAEELPHIEQSGLAGWLARYEGDFAGTTDAVLRNTVGLGVRAAGAYENLWRGASYAGNRLSGMSGADAFAAMRTGFVNYPPAALAPFDKAIKHLTFFWPYARQRIPQVAQASLERPWLMTAPLKLKECIELGFPASEQQLLAGRPNNFRYAPERIAFPWDLWPMSTIGDDLPQEAKDNYISHLSYRAPPLGSIVDLARMTGATSRTPGLDPLQAMEQSLHPYWKASLWALKGEGSIALQEMFPVASRTIERARIDPEGTTGRIVRGLGKTKIVRWLGDKVGINTETIGELTSEEKERLYRRYRQPFSFENPETPARTDMLLTMERARLKAGNMGAILTFTSKNEAWGRLSLGQVDELQAARSAEGLAPLRLSSQHLANIRKHMTMATGRGPQTPSETRRWNDDVKRYTAEGGRVADVVSWWERKDRQERESALGLDSWLQVRAEQRKAGEPLSPLSDPAFRDINILLEKLKHPSVTMGELMEADAKSRPSNLPAMQRWWQKQGPAKKDECSADLQKALLDECGHGDAEKIGDWFVENKDYTTMPQGTAPQPGDMIWFPTRNVHGHVGLSFEDPMEQNRLRLYSNYAGNTGFMDIPAGKALKIYRPPQVTELDIGLRKLGK